MAESEEIQKNCPELRGSFLKSLPISIKRYPYEGESSFLHILDVEIGCREDSGNQTNDFILFHMGCQTIDTLLHSNDDDPTVLTHLCSSYDLDEQLVLIKMPSLEHAIAIGAVDNAITKALLPMGLFDHLRKYIGATIQGTRRGKIPDNGWGSKRPPPGSPKRPSVVLEVAWYESDAKLNSDVRFWLNPADGNARICLTLRTDRHKPAIRIENWALQNGRIHRFQNIEMTKVSDKIQVINHPLIIPFEDLFLRPPSIPAERDIEISQQALEEIAETIWDIQGF